jgi:hypothetical protein
MLVYLSKRSNITSQRSALASLFRTNKKLLTSVKKNSSDNEWDKQNLRPHPQSSIFFNFARENRNFSSVKNIEYT